MHSSEYRAKAEECRQRANDPTLTEGRRRLWEHLYTSWIACAEEREAIEREQDAGSASPQANTATRVQGEAATAILPGIALADWRANPRPAARKRRSNSFRKEFKKVTPALRALTRS